jgi:FKBP-type peptidyl-prolyl cis-trans isomerase FkpA
MTSYRTYLSRLRKGALVAGILFCVVTPLATTSAAMAAPDHVEVKALREGYGALITESDGEVINYTGRLSDGTVFDTNRDTQPVSLLVNEVIPGLSQSFLLMRAGGQYEVFVPANLAYRDSPPPGSVVPKDADLTFEIEILEVVANAADAQ